MSQSFRTTRLVEFRDTDAAGIVHFATFFDWMEEVEHEFLRHLGLSVMMIGDEDRISFPRVHASCDFESSLRFEDVVDIEMTVRQLGKSSVCYGFRFSCEGSSIAEGKVVAVCCRIDPDTAPKSIPIPKWVVEKLQGVSE